jgi:hypothetical protein
MGRPGPDEYAEFYAGYVRLVPEDDAVAVLREEGARTDAFLRGVPHHEADRPHPPYTWTFREVVQHLIDAERVFAYRALRFARGDATPLPGYDERAWAAEADVRARSLPGLADEWHALRAANVAFFETLPEPAWDRRGEANGAPCTVRALAHIIAGHERHHLAILRARLSSGRSP